MKMKLVFSLLASAMVLFSTALFSQSDDDVIMRAMEDELQRSMDSLSMEDCDSPFYIAYTFYNFYNRTATASLGGLVSSEEGPERDRGTRVMVGDYDFNDESFDDSADPDVRFESRIIPIEDDYYTLRKLYWESTDNVFRGACQAYNNHVEALEKEEVLLDSIDHKRFAKVDPLVLVENATAKPGSMTWLEDYAKKVSALALDYPELATSLVIASSVESDYYFLTSEGAKIKSWSMAHAVLIQLEYLLESGQPVSELLVYSAENKEELPALETVKSDMAAMIKWLKGTSERKALDESYEGPILFLGDAVPQALAKGVFNAYKASPSAESIGSKSQANYNSGTKSMDERIGEEVSSEYLTVVLDPARETHNGIRLAGSYAFDREGVAPKSPMTILENGVLKNVMTTRTLSKESHECNGYGNGLGVIEVTSSKTFDEAKLKKMLIKAAKKQDLDYAIIIRGFSPAGSSECYAYKVSLKDGSETPIQKANFGSFYSSKLKEFMGSTSTMQVYNTTPLGGGDPQSFIVPTAMLMDEMTVRPDRYTREYEAPLVPNPLTP